MESGYDRIPPGILRSYIRAGNFFLQVVHTARRGPGVYRGLLAAAGEGEIRFFLYVRCSGTPPRYLVFGTGTSIGHLFSRKTISMLWILEGGQQGGGKKLEFGHKIREVWGKPSVLSFQKTGKVGTPDRRRRASSHRMRAPLFPVGHHKKQTSRDFRK